MDIMPTRMRSLGTLLAAALAAGGCGTPRAAEIDARGVYDLPGEMDPASLSLSLRVFRVTPAGDRAVADGEAFHSGDRFYLQVRASRQAHVYAVWFTPNGDANVLFPDDSAQLVSPHCPLRIPRRGALYLRDPVGLEQLRVVASAEPLGVADRRRCEELKLPCAPPVGPPQVAPCEPPPATTGRGVLPALKTARAPSDGVADLEFPFRHEQ